LHIFLSDFQHIIKIPIFHFFLFVYLLYIQPSLSYQKEILMQKNNRFSIVRGKIKKLFMAAPQSGDKNHFERIASVSKQLYSDCLLVVWCNNNVILRELHIFLMQEGVNIKTCWIGNTIPIDTPCVLIAPKDGFESYSKWVRDVFICSTSLDQKSTIMAKMGVPKDSDIYWVERHLQQMRFDDGTYFTLHNDIMPGAGGNFMVDYNTVMVGVNQFLWHIVASRNADAPKIPGNPEGVRWIEIGKDIQPVPRKLGHIDLYLSLTGCVSSISGRPIIMVATCHLLNVGNYPDLTLVAERMNKWLNTVANNLERDGFHILRNPMPLLKNEKTNAFYLCTLNNCLVEATLFQRTVWLPNITQGQESEVYYHQLQQTEQDNAKIWGKLGFEVRFIAGDFHELMNEEGSLHCITNELFRTPPDTQLIEVNI
jgi:hypothetical protein